MHDGLLAAYIDDEAEPGGETQQHLIDFEFEGVDAAKGVQGFAQGLFPQGFVVEPYAETVPGGQLFEVAFYPFAGVYRMGRKGWNQYGIFMVEGRYIRRVSAAYP